MQEINISIKYTNGQSFPVIIQKDEDTTVLEMKQQIETQSQIPANDQRLIFKGKVLKDELTIEEYGIENGSGVHLVRRSPNNNSAPRQESQNTSSTSSTSFTSSTSNSTSGFTIPPNFNQQQQNPFGMDPNQIQNAMNNPLVQQMLNDPEILHQMMLMNPQLRRMSEDNPEIGRMLSNPEILQRAMEIARDPEALRQMMQNQDRALNNIEGMPGGFSALRRYIRDFDTDIHEGRNSSQSRQESNSTSSSSQGAPMPNPWASNTQQQSSSGGNSGFGFGGDDNFGGLGGLNGMNIDQMQQMMQNPIVQQMMDSLSQNPEIMRTMLMNSPQAQNNPFMQQILSNPELFRQTMQMSNFLFRSGQNQSQNNSSDQPQNNSFMNFNPQMMQQMMQQMQNLPNTNPLFSSMNLGSNQSSTSSNSNTTNPSNTSNTNTTNSSNTSESFQSSSTQNPFGNFNQSFMDQMMQSFMGGNQSFQPQPQQQSLDQLRTQYATQLAQLREMGFYDEATNLQALQRTQGNVSAAIEYIFSIPQSRQ